MKYINKKLILIILLLLTAFMLACGKSTDINQDDEALKLPENTCYDDGMTVEGICFKPISYGRDYFTYQEFSTVITLTIVNLTTEPRELRSKSVKIIRESDNKEYIINNYSDRSLVYGLKPNKPVSNDIYFKIETALSEDNYDLVLDFGDITYTIYLRENPKYAKKDITVTYIVNGNYACSDTIKSGRIAPRLKEYISKNKLKYVTKNDWYFEGDYNAHITYSNIITDDIVLEATYRNIYNYNREFGYATISKINYVPESKVLVIPNDIESCAPLFDCDTPYYLEEIYLPSNVAFSDKFNFLNGRNLKTIYFEGSEEEFNAIIDGKAFNKLDITEIVYNVKYND